MVWFHRYQGLSLVLLLAFGLCSAAVAAQEDTSGLYDRPVLILDPGMHTAPIRRADVDAAGVYAVTGSLDKTVRVWSVPQGKLERTIRLPQGSGHVGQVFAVAISPDGSLVAAGGWTRGLPGKEQIYLFDRPTGALVRRIEGLPDVVYHLVFSADGRSLAATLAGSNGLRVYGREAGWAEVGRDMDYEGDSYGAAFAADGRLATTSFDGRLRLYDRGFRRVAMVKAADGTRPFGIAFDPAGDKLSVGYYDSTALSIFDGRDLSPLPGPDTKGINSGNLSKVTWSADGATLYAGGQYEGDGNRPVVAWSDAEAGARRELPAGLTTVMSLLPLSEGGLLVASQDPYLALLDSDRTPRLEQRARQADLRGQMGTLAVSVDGNLVDFGFEIWGDAPARFDLEKLALRLDPPEDGLTAVPVQTGLEVEDWVNNTRPTLNGEPLPLKRYETSRSLAIHPDGERFLLGTDWNLRAFDAKGETLWQRTAPGVTWAVNITGDGRQAIAAYDDGTIRWYRMDDGRELLAFFPMADRKNWVAWTPEGFYGATPGAYGVLRWHVNRGWDAAGESVPVADIPLLRRPRVLPLVLQEMETARALGLDNLQEAMRAVQLRTRSSVPPGARLHLLTVGISDYGRLAKHLQLKFAHQDANDIANAIRSTQTGLYAAVEYQALRDGEATKTGIYRALDTLRRGMAAGEPGRDLAVVHFSGHGAMIDGSFYLLPHGVDATDPVSVAASGLAIGELRARLRKLGEYGRVLVLLDACRSGAATANGVDFTVNAATLRTALATANVTVLTSSEAGQLSREDPAWGNGAFTEALLDALRLADDDRNGLISVTELINYLATHVPRITGNKQTPGMEARFESDVFVADL